MILSDIDRVIILLGYSVIKCVVLDIIYIKWYKGFGISDLLVFDLVYMII